jgi:hypothetical protein
MTGDTPATRVPHVTVARNGLVRWYDALHDYYTVTLDALPGRTFGSWTFDETCRDLTVSALLSPADARALVLDAWAAGSASRPVGER